MTAFVALHHRNFRLLWTGQLISVTGTMMQTAAILWHVSLLPLVVGVIVAIHLLLVRRRGVVPPIDAADPRESLLRADAEGEVRP